MSGGSTQTTQDTSQTRNPYAPAAPALQTLVGGALDAYRSDPNGSFFTGPRVAGFSPTTQAGMGMIRSAAGGAAGLADAGSDYLRQTINRGGSTADTRAATRGLLGVDTANLAGLRTSANRLSDPNSLASTAANRVAGGEFALDGSGYSDLNAGLAGPTQVSRSLQDVADGKYLSGGNPYLDEMIAKSQADAANKVKGSFAASGRYGSGMFTQALGDTVSRTALDARYSDYNQERERQAQAAQAIDSGLLSRTAARQSLYGSENDVRSTNAGQVLQGGQLGLSADQAGLTGQQALVGAQQANAAQRIGQYGAALSGAQSDRSAAMGAAGMIPSMQQAMFAPGQAMLGAGGLQDQRNQAVINADMQRFAEQQAGPWRQLGLLSGITMPVAGAGGTTTGQTVTTPPQPDWWQQLLGYGLAGADVASRRWRAESAAALPVAPQL